LHKCAPCRQASNPKLQAVTSQLRLPKHQHNHQKFA
jgi:hypothetical protein